MGNSGMGMNPEELYKGISSVQVGHWTGYG